MLLTAKKDEKGSKAQRSWELRRGEVVMRKFIVLLLLASLLMMSWFIFERYPSLGNIVKEKLGFTQFYCFKPQISADEIMQKNAASLLKEGRTFLESELQFYPCLFMEVKYVKNGSTEESSLIWDLTSAEMVIETANWKKTHGFEDCLNAKLNENEGKLIMALAGCEGGLEKSKLIEKYKQDDLEKVIAAVLSKRLVVETGSKLRLHIQNPSLENVPSTVIKTPLVTFAKGQGSKMEKKYSTGQIKKLLSFMYGNEFIIRHTKQVFLPVYLIPLQNRDGSILNTYWNSLSGKQVDEFLRETI